MYRPPHFDMPDLKEMVAFTHAFSFATLVSHGPNGMIATHLPLLLRQSGDDLSIIGHVAKANPHLRLLDGETSALAVFQGHHGYISPRYYVSEKMVPTWNYTAVHITGAPQAISDADETMEILKTLTDFYEATATEPWRVNRLPEDFQAAQRKGLVAFRMAVAKIEGKKKLSQNRARQDVEGAIQGLRDTGTPGDAALADDMAKGLR